MTNYINTSITLFFVLAPFFVLSMFLAMTTGMERKLRRRNAIKVTLAVLVICLLLYFFGDVIFRIFGITIDSFRVGAGILLFLSSIDLVRQSKKSLSNDFDTDDFAVVPLSIPITVGPATIGTLLVMGAETKLGPDMIIGCLSLTTAIFCLGIILYTANIIERALGAKGITIMSKLTGLILAALASQIIMDGINGFFKLGA